MRCTTTQHARRTHRRPDLPNGFTARSYLGLANPLLIPEASSTFPLTTLSKLAGRRKLAEQNIEESVYDERRVQDTVLALMHLNAHKDTFGWRAWKSFPWEATDGLYERGLISDPRSKAKSVALTEEGAQLAEQLFGEFFGKADADTDG